MADKIRMTKPQDKAIAEAHVSPDRVAIWEAAGWVADKPKRATKAKADPKDD